MGERSGAQEGKDGTVLQAQGGVDGEDRLDAFDAHERPHGLAGLEQLGARARSARVAEQAALQEQSLDPRAKRAHENLESGAREGAITDPMPPREHALGFLQELAPDAARGAGALGDRGEVADQVAPAELTLPQRPEVVRAVTVGAQDA